MQCSRCGGYHCYLTRPAMVRRLRERHGDACWFCGYPILFDEKQMPCSPTVDHIVERSKGGCTRDHNIRLAHRFCNGARSNGPWTAGKQESWQRKVLRHLVERKRVLAALANSLKG